MGGLPVLIAWVAGLTGILDSHRPVTDVLAEVPEERAAEFGPWLAKTCLGNRKPVLRAAVARPAPVAHPVLPAPARCIVDPPA